MDLTRTVLLAEDEAILRDTLAVALAHHGYEVVAIGTGTEAIAAAADRLPDLAIIDMLLPGESGFQVTGVVKDLSAGRVPVIMMSGNTSAAHRDYALAAGVDAFLPKPFDPDRLLELADSLCPPVTPRVVFRTARRACV
jgi:DNA-binding response OmpR family regulator